MLAGEADGLVVAKQHPSALPGPHLAFAEVSLGIPNQGRELKGEATWKKKAKNNCSLLCSRRRKGDTRSLVRKQSGEQEGLLTDAHKRGILRPGGKFAPLVLLALGAP